MTHLDSSSRITSDTPPSRPSRSALSCAARHSSSSMRRLRSGLGIGFERFASVDRSPLTVGLRNSEHESTSIDGVLRDGADDLCARGGYVRGGRADEIGAVGVVGRQFVLVNRDLHEPSVYTAVYTRQGVVA
ncbi:hypothetical protein PROPHIT491_23 [Mycobacterium phage prophiT49-1]|nr:hypothetical protein PROPHIT491_23 [Mycobacterium phage prophiT49-1]